MNFVTFVGFLKVYCSTCTVFLSLWTECLVIPAHHDEGQGAGEFIGCALSRTRMWGWLRCENQSSDLPGDFCLLDELC